MNDLKRMKPLTLAGILLGIGMGGFLDGIVFHQIMQIHNMVSNRLFPDTLVNSEINMFWDGLFHAFTWTSTAIGLGLLWKVAKQGEVPLVTKFFAGSMVLGWGLFNLVEGIIDHHILQVHHVVQRAVGSERLLWDLAFDISGIILIAVGVSMRRHSSLEVTSQGRTRNTFQPTHSPA